MLVSCRTRSGLNPNSPKQHHRPLFKEADCEGRKGNNYSLKSESNHLADRISRKQKQQQRNFGDFNPFSERDNGSSSSILQFDDYPSSSSAAGHQNSGQLPSRPSAKLFSMPTSNSPMQREDGASFQGAANSSDDHFLRRSDRLAGEHSSEHSGEYSGDHLGDHSSSSREEEFKRCFKQLTGEGFEAGQVVKALSIANNRIPFAKEILKHQFASQKD